MPPRSARSISGTRTRGGEVVGIAERTLGTVFKRSGVKNAHAHRFRHTLATRLLEQGATFEEVADILGNSPAVVRVGASFVMGASQRLHVEFGPEDRFDNPRAVQIRLRNFDIQGLVEVGRKVRDLVAEGSSAADRIRQLADDAYLEALARAMVGALGGKVGLAPRLYLKKLVGDVLDRIEQFPDFDPRTHLSLTLAGAELSLEERAAASVDDIELKL